MLGNGTQRGLLTALLPVDHGPHGSLQSSASYIRNPGVSSDLQYHC